MSFYSAVKTSNFSLVIDRLLLFYRKEKKPTTSAVGVSLLLLDF